MELIPIWYEFKISEGTKLELLLQEISWFSPKSDQIRTLAFASTSVTDTVALLDLFNYCACLRYDLVDLSSIILH